MDKRTYTFEEMPNIMADVVVQLRTLSEKVDVLTNSKRNLLPAKSSTFVPSHRTTLTTSALCKILHKNKQAVYRLVAANQIPYYKQGKTLGFFEDEIYKWLEDKKGAEVNYAKVDQAAMEYCVNNGI